MAGLPEITIAGTVVADPEIRYTNSGAAVANFTVAANDRRFDREKGEWVDAGATFLRCSIWRQAAENVAETITKATRTSGASAAPAGQPDPWGSAAPTAAPAGGGGGFVEEPPF
ncbi:single-stranded DNA-binding protein [Saccharopolyspora hirsuta]|uniref:Single-stranded DNA-binding protein n=1 Tax=Saccharopolyspora hirsuta TaxID=1837 RepID=A0A5M7BIQ5_SACHI|nr:single-stranded DNA-binding protein [Saccharopolyspora hirsuta]KAA5829552.1 single-stranded DNA-binding protein [Saccharopolyspora hirsuta]